MRWRRPIILNCFFAATAILAAGCGGGSSPGVASLNSSTATSVSSPAGPPTQAELQREQHDATRFAVCMRAHGVPIPNPTVAPRAFKNAFSAQSSPAFRSAYTVCGHFLPAGHGPNQSTARSQRQTAALLAFARCLQGHGFPGFPDPNSSGELTHEMLASAGIDLHQPAVVRAADACTRVTHGVITKAVVAHFVAGH